jgi:hypothetical protein
MYVCFRSFNFVSVPNQENGLSCMCVLGVLILTLYQTRRMGSHVCVLYRDQIKIPKTYIHDCPFSWFGTEIKLKLLKHTYMTAHSPGLVQRQN